MLRPVNVSMPSLQSLPARLVRATAADPTDERDLGSATCFVVGDENGLYLITNWHVVTRLNPDTRKPIGHSAALPESIIVMHNERDRLGRWVERRHALYDRAGRSRWFLHPRFRERIDVVALPIDRDPAVDYFPYELNPMPRPVIEPATDVSIIGYPFGRKTSGEIGVWSRGTIASEPELDFEGLPMFLIDSRTRKGQSGSPVIYRSDSPHLIREDGSSYQTMGMTVTALIGVYSGRISEESDLGKVWRASAVSEILATRMPDWIEFE